MKTRSDPGLLESYRKQCEWMAERGASPWTVWIAWRGQVGMDADEMMDIAREIDESMDRPGKYAP